MGRGGGEGEKKPGDESKRHMLLLSDLPIDTSLSSSDSLELSS